MGTERLHHAVSTLVMHKVLEGEDEPRVRIPGRLNFLSYTSRVDCYRIANVFHARSNFTTFVVGN